MMARTVASSNIRSLGYDALTCELEVQFRSGAVYRYASVPSEVYNAFLAAESKGSFFARIIKPRFACELIESPSIQGPQMPLGIALERSRR